MGRPRRQLRDDETEVRVSAALPRPLVDQLDELATEMNEGPLRQAGMLNKASRTTALHKAARAGLEVEEREAELERKEQELRLREAVLEEGELRAAAQKPADTEATAAEERRRRQLRLGRRGSRGFTGLNKATLQVLGELLDRQRPLGTVSSIATNTGRTEHSVRGALGRLRQQGLVSVVGCAWAGNRGRSARMWAATALAQRQAGVLEAVEPADRPAETRGTAAWLLPDRLSKKPSAGAPRRRPTIYGRPMTEEELRLLRALVAVGENGATRNELAQMTRIAKGSVTYRLKLFANAALARRSPPREPRRWFPGRLAAARAREAGPEKGDS